jgi:hypothetical protein
VHAEFVIHTCAACVGARVLRATTDWRWAAQDGGDGHMGCVRAVAHDCADGSGGVVVAWDAGAVGNYAGGDVRVFDAMSR